MEGESYRKIFRDIVVGHSEVDLLDSHFYIKHLSALDQVDIDDIRAKYLKESKLRGIPTEEEVVNDLKSQGVWSNEEDEEITRKENFILQLQKTKSQLVLKSQIEKQNDVIQQTRAEVNELKNKKTSLIGVSAENYSDKRSNDHYIIKSFYCDSELKKPAFPTAKDFDELYSDDVSHFIQKYNNTFKMFEELKIQEMILQDFYYIYFPFSDDTVGFFGNPVCHLTYNQLKLIVYTKIFKNIFENNQHIPDKIKKDPQALLDYGSISDDAKNKMAEQLSSDKDGTTLFGATAEDYEYAGLEKPNSGAKISLHEAAERKGGSLSMQDLMELSGHGPK